MEWMLKDGLFNNYEECMNSLFYCVNLKINIYLEKMKFLYSQGSGGYKNVLYPDLEIASDTCQIQIQQFLNLNEPSKEEEDDFEIDDDLRNLLDSFTDHSQGEGEKKEEPQESIANQIGLIINRAKLTREQGISLPMFDLCEKLKATEFTVFCFACGILSSVQTSYGSIFQVINQNSVLAVPTIESAARIYYGDDFSIPVHYSEMSLCLEQLKTILELKIDSQLPFSTGIAPDKRLIDYLFGKNPLVLDSAYKRFFGFLTNEKNLEPVMANEKRLDALHISFDSGVRLFSLWGDEGSGRKFFIRHFCRKRNLRCITIDCKKLFVYEMNFVEQALWAVCRECILTDSCCCLDGLSYRDEEKENFFGLLDMAYSKLLAEGITVFNVSEDKIPLREATRMEYTQLELETPTNYERLDIWKYYAAGYQLNPDVDLEEMAAKFLFTPGKIKNALHQGKSLSEMERAGDIIRTCLFEACYNQMKHELTQKATKVKVSYTWDDIVMNPAQRETLEHVCEQMTYRRQVYEGWDYNRKYPYGRGLSVLLFGAPGTGKSMCAQVIASALNLELYRVDLSKVIDKYIGETEKSISMIFREAKKCNVVLFFDEADTMFGKRTDSGGAGEQAANNKTAHLLQEIEAYDGVTVLATNYKHNIDPAFFRRMKFIVEFQFPDPDTRYMLWKTTIPKGTPLAKDVDLRFLAERFEFAGGNIKNCILNAAFFAAAEGDGEMVHMKHYLMAIRYEFVKTGKIFAKTDFEPYASLLGL